MIVHHSQSVPLHQSEELANLVGLRLAAYVLQIDKFVNARVNENVMASARAPELEAERLHQPPHIREGDVRDIATSEPRKQPSRIHVAKLPPLPDEPRGCATVAC